MTSQRWDAELYDQKHAFVADYGRELIGLLAPAPDERILDLGCGTGHLTAEVAATGADVVGLDHSEDMLAAARDKYPTLTFVLGDATAFEFPAAFDGVFSNAVLHWVMDAEGVVRSVARALRPGGRFVAEFGGRGNVRRIAAAVRRAVREVAGVTVESPWYTPTVGEYAALLERHGLEVRFATLFDRVTPLEGGSDGLRNFIAMFCGRMTAPVPADRRDDLLARVEDLARAELFKDGRWHADYRRIRVVAVRDPTLGPR
jgi:trans-aconitate methyltransferase